MTIVPLLSQSSPALPAEVLKDEAKLAELVKRIQFGGDGQCDAFTPPLPFCSFTFVPLPSAVGRQPNWRPSR